jgi:hypothetical protein
VRPDDSTYKYIHIPHVHACILAGAIHIQIHMDISTHTCMHIYISILAYIHKYIHTYIQANKAGAAGGVGRAEDKDSLQLDYNEFKIFVKLLANKLGITLRPEDVAPNIVIKQVCL